MWPQARPAHGHTSIGRSAGQFLILAGLAILLAGVLPFVCWGSSADPGHAHALPHFVFAAPTLHAAMDVHPASHAAPEATGGARPALLLLTLVGVALAGEWRCPTLHRWRAVRRRPHPSARQRWLPVPTPPPR